MKQKEGNANLNLREKHLLLKNKLFGVYAANDNLEAIESRFSQGRIENKRPL
jgi:hypothetical protein